MQRRACKACATGQCQSGVVCAGAQAQCQSGVVHAGAIAVRRYGIHAGRVEQGRRPGSREASSSQVQQLAGADATPMITFISSGGACASISTCNARSRKPAKECGDRAASTIVALITGMGGG